MDRTRLLLHDSPLRSVSSYLLDESPAIFSIHLEIIVSICIFVNFSVEMIYFWTMAFLMKQFQYKAISEINTGNQKDD